MKKHFVPIAGILFIILLMALLARGIFNSIPEHSPQNLTKISELFLDTQVYQPGQNPFPKDASFLSPNGSPVRIKEWRGDYLLLNLWATWCPGCVIELPSLNHLAEEYEEKGLKVVAVSLDQQKTQQELKAFLNDHDIDSLALYHDQENLIMRRYAVRGMPTTLLISPRGDILVEFLGEADWTDGKLKAFLDSYLTQ